VIWYTVTVFFSTYLVYPVEVASLPSKCWYLSNELNGIMSYKTVIFHKNLKPHTLHVQGKCFWLHCGPEVDSLSNRNEYQEYFLGVKAAGV